MAQKILYFRSDDAGLSVGTNQGIEQAACFCKSIGLMAVGPAIDDAAQRFASRKDLCLGLHVTINAEWQNVDFHPISPPSTIPSLLDSERRLRATPWLQNESVRLEEIEREMAAQLALLRAKGFNVRYLDFHMRAAGAIPGLGTLAAEFAQREGLNYLDHLRGLQHGPYDSKDAALLQWEVLLRDLQPEPKLVIFHPASPDPVMENLLLRNGNPGPLKARMHERDFLSSGQLLPLLESSGVTAAPCA